MYCQNKICSEITIWRYFEKYIFVTYFHLFICISILQKEELVLLKYIIMFIQRFMALTDRLYLTMFNETIVIHYIPGKQELGHMVTQTFPQDNDVLNICGFDQERQFDFGVKSVDARTQKFKDTYGNTLHAQFVIKMV